MKSKEKPLGTRAQIRASKERQRRIVKAIFLVFILLIVVFSSYFTYNFLSQPQNQTTNPTSLQLRAAIIDQLSLTCPNQTFVETATNILKQAGYTVDYYPGEKATVELYRNLPTHDYSIIILRVHSAVGSGNQPPLALFTSELVSNTKYVSEQLADRLQGVAFLPYKPGDPTFFGIPPKFVSLSMNGRFQNTIIIAMGCDGLTYSDMANAFILKGAEAYIGWKGSVSASHTDLATSHLLQHFVIEKQTLTSAINETTQEVGADPSYSSLLAYYPLEAGEQTIENAP
jgi:hypothetical protein